MTRRAALLAALALGAGCGGPGRSSAPPAPPPEEPAARARPAPRAEEPLAVEGVRAPTAAEEEALRSIVRSTERVRRLRFDGPVRIDVETPARITQRFLDELEDEDLDEMQIAYEALGLLPPGIDLRALLARVLGEQVVGYYDSEAARLVLREDVMGWLGARSGPLGADQRSARLVILHELVHALQDQHFDLEAFEPESLRSDEALARRALVEGDATLALVAHSLESVRRPLESVTRNRAVLEQLLATDESGGPENAELRAAPPIVRVGLVSPYLAGTRLAGALHARGGWPAVDAAFAEPPTSSEQVLHPEKYLAREPPLAVAVPPLPELEAAGHRRLDVDTLGELELGVYFGQGTGADVDAAAAEGWGGDELAIHVGPDGAPSAVWFTAWDDLEAARGAEIAARRVQGALPPAARARAVVAREGAAVLIVRGLPGALHPPVLRAFAAFAATVAAPTRPAPRDGAAPGPILDAPGAEG